MGVLPLAIATLFFLIGTGFCADNSAPPNSSPRRLERSQGKRWKHLKDILKGEIKANAKNFLQDRKQHLQALSLPVEVDVVLIGFEGDGAYGYTLDSYELDEQLASGLDQEVCPTVWESGRQTALCFNLKFITLNTASLQSLILLDIEHVLAANMMRVGERHVDDSMPGTGASTMPVFEVDAIHLEALLLKHLNQIYNNEGLSDGEQGDGRSAILVLNPNKLRMNPMLHAEAAHELAGKHWGLADSWKRGKVLPATLLEQEGDYLYRYTYNGRGAAAAWVSAHNFMVIDLSAGPVVFGPMASPSGTVTPSALPRILPIMLRLSRELEQAAPTMTLEEHMAQEAAEGQHRLLVGQLAGVLHAAARHLLVPDVALQHLEYADRLLVHLVVLQDHLEFNLLDGIVSALGPGIETALDVAAVQHAAELMSDSQQVRAGAARRSAGVGNRLNVAVRLQGAFIHHHQGVLAALSRARTSWSQAVLRSPPYLGLHHSRRLVLDSTVLIEELRRLLPLYVGEGQGQGQSQDLEQGPGSSQSCMPAQLPGLLACCADEHLQSQQNSRLTATMRHNGTRQLPVFVLSLRSAPPGLLFDNGQLVAATQDMVVVLQLLQAVDNSSSQVEEEKGVTRGTLLPGMGPSVSGVSCTDCAPSLQATSPKVEGASSHGLYDEDEELPPDEGNSHLYSGHLLEGKPLMLSGASGVTGRVIGGMAMALAGVVPQFERVDHSAGAVRTQDWRWSVGCLPWGPYANSSSLSGLVLAAARRNVLAAHLETAVMAVQSRLDRVDTVVDRVFGGPWTELLDLSKASRGKEGGPTTRRHWLDVLANHTHGFNLSLTPSVVGAMEQALRVVEEHVEQVSWALVGQDWRRLEQLLPPLLMAVDAFSLTVDTNLDATLHVAACCQVIHAQPNIVNLVVIGVLGLLLCSLAAVGSLVMSRSKVNRPNKRSGQPTQYGVTQQRPGLPLERRPGSWLSGGGSGSGHLLPR
ncbi:hypothetical protein QJQ45_021541 [Haematococcus lacustris]|nr:hypothetical protein QJQ45_021541 [Haematococcus lacustris]